MQITSKSHQTFLVSTPKTVLHIQPTRNNSHFGIHPLVISLTTSVSLTTFSLAGQIHFYIAGIDWESCKEHFFMSAFWNLLSRSVSWFSATSSICSLLSCFEGFTALFPPSLSSHVQYWWAVSNLQGKTECIFFLPLSFILKTELFI